jgi:hypothetical protein
MLKKILCGATLLCAAGFSNAALITETGSIAVQNTNFTRTVDIAQFDTDLGTLNSVMVTLDGQIVGDIRVQNRDAEAATIVSNLAATLTLSNGINPMLVVAIPTITNSFAASAFGGAPGDPANYTSPTGQTLLDQMGSASAMNTFMDMMTLGFFSAAGGGVTTFTLDAEASSSTSGAGNLRSQFDTRAGGVISVKYDYTPPPVVGVSAPSHVALLGLGLLAFAGLRKVRK